MSFGRAFPDPSIAVADLMTALEKASRCVVFLSFVCLLCLIGCDVMSSISSLPSLSVAARVFEKCLLCYVCSVFIYNEAQKRIGGHYGIVKDTVKQWKLGPRSVCQAWLVHIMEELFSCFNVFGSLCILRNT